VDFGFIGFQSNYKTQESVVYFVKYLIFMKFFIRKGFFSSKQLFYSNLRRTFLEKELK